VAEEMKHQNREIKNPSTLVWSPYLDFGFEFGVFAFHRLNRHLNGVAEHRRLLHHQDSALSRRKQPLRADIPVAKEEEKK